ncbi:hypothetical protein IscW_ISCW004611, partial [Ixodes scapularis]
PSEILELRAAHTLLLKFNKLLASLDHKCIDAVFFIGCRCWAVVFPCWAILFPDHVGPENLNLNAGTQSVVTSAHQTAASSHLFELGSTQVADSEGGGESGYSDPTPSGHTCFCVR